MIAAVSRSIPFPNITSGQAVKVTAVALASLLYFGPIWALALAGMTLCSELSLRSNQESNWFNTHSFSVYKLVEDAWTNVEGRLVIVIAWVALITLGLAIIPASPIQVKLAEMALETPLLFLFKAIVLAPICEEILFRGYLQERLEDSMNLFSRHIYTLPKDTEKNLASVGQAAIFGCAHITGGQVNDAVRWVVALSLGWTGFVWGQRKQEEDSLMLPMASHALNNTFAALFLLRST
jgi:membrane protease YdiL (CAAX protease family)